MTKPNPKPPPEVTAIASGPDERGRQLVIISVGRDTDVYDVKPFAADFGPAYRVVKLLNEKKKTEGDYSVSLHGTGHCSCPGHAFHGYCRHVAALLSLWSRGELCTVHHAKALLERRAGKAEGK